MNEIASASVHAAPFFTEIVAFPCLVFHVCAFVVLQFMAAVCEFAS
jgi:hypothetical protein